MKNIFLVSILALGLFQCGEKVEEQFSLPVNLKGKIFCYDEFGGIREDDVSGIKVAVIAQSEVASTMTDAGGEFELEGFSTGTYSLSATREGYGDAFFSGLKLIGGAEPFYQIFSMHGKSTTTVENVVLYYDGLTLRMTGTVNHHHPNIGYTGVSFVAFMSSSPTVSSSNYEHSFTMETTEQSGSSFNLPFYYDWQKFSPGETLYVVVFGKARYDYGWYDPATKTMRYSSVGNVASNVANILIQ